MVQILSKWEDFKDYAAFCRYGAFMIKKFSERIEVRVRAGSFGFKAEFKLNEKGEIRNSEEAELFCSITKFLKERGYYEVVTTIPDDQFFV